MRNYELMRSILCKAATLKEPLSIGVFLSHYDFEEIKEEITRLSDEGLIQHSIVWEACEMASGKITGITEEGRAFLRNIENERVWMLIEFDYQLNRHCSKTVRLRCMWENQFDYQLNRHCSKTVEKLANVFGGLITS